jgi:heat shock protein HslJ
MTRRALVSDALLVGLLLGAVHCGPAREKAPSDAEVTPSTDSVSQNAQAGLGGTSWRLVKFQGSDETTLTPADGAEYTIAFEPGGRLTARIDCNRGRGTWKSSGPPQLEFGPLALTRAMCPPGSLHDHIVKQWPYVRSYVIRDGHLFLSLMADGGIYEFEPMSPGGNMEGAIRGTATYRERMALPPGAVLEATLEDVSKADAAAEVIGRGQVENPGNPPIRFEIPYDPSRIPALPGADRGQGQRGGVAVTACGRLERGHGVPGEHVLEADASGGRTRHRGFRTTGASSDPQFDDWARDRLGRLQPDDGPWDWSPAA